MSQKAKDPKSEDTRLTISFFNYSKWNTIANYETEYVHVVCLCVSTGIRTLIILG